MLGIQFPKFVFQYKQSGGVQHIFDIVRKKYIQLTPEEWVRQNLIHYLIFEKKYPKGLISVEKEITVNNLKKRYDIVVYAANQKPWMLIECKEPDVAITEKTLSQLLNYHQVLQCPFWVLSNGNQNFCAQLEKGRVSWLKNLPVYGI